MAEAQGVQDERMAAGQASGSPGVMLSVRIESKLGLGPCERQDSRRKADDEPAPAKRARLRRHTQRM
ncbi:MAG: hypothetical protein ACRDPP_10260 [Gaiellaceae bacterium]